MAQQKPNPNSIQDYSNLYNSPSWTGKFWYKKYSNSKKAYYYVNEQIKDGRNPYLSTFERPHDYCKFDTPNFKKLLVSAGPDGKTILNRNCLRNMFDIIAENANKKKDDIKMDVTFKIATHLKQQLAFSQLHENKFEPNPRTPIGYKNPANETEIRSPDARPNKRARSPGSPTPQKRRRSSTRSPDRFSRRSNDRRYDDRRRDSRSPRRRSPYRERSDDRRRDSHSGFRPSFRDGPRDGGDRYRSSRGRDGGGGGGYQSRGGYSSRGRDGGGGFRGGHSSRGRDGGGSFRGGHSSRGRDGGGSFRGSFSSRGRDGGFNSRNERGGYASRGRDVDRRGGGGGFRGSRGRDFGRGGGRDGGFRGRGGSRGRDFGRGGGSRGRDFGRGGSRGRDFGRGGRGGGRGGSRGRDGGFRGRGGGRGGSFGGGRGGGRGGFGSDRGGRQSFGGFENKNAIDDLIDQHDARKEHADDFEKQMQAFMQTGQAGGDDNQSTATNKLEELKVDHDAIEKEILAGNQGKANDGPEEPPSDSDDD